MKIKPRKVKVNELNEGYNFEAKKDNENGKDNYLINLLNFNFIH